MIYTVLKIEEDLDYGCEDRRDDQPVMAVVTLRNVGILSNIEGHTLIGCDSCDMHIELDITGDIDI